MFHVDKRPDGQLRGWADLAERPAILEPEPRPRDESLAGPGGGSLSSVMSAFEHWTEGLWPPELPTGDTSQHPSMRENDPGLLGRPMQMINDLGRGISQEGMLALLDPRGAIDRQDAQRDLASRFDIVDPGSDGQRRGNALTQGEFERVARDFSDIRLGRGKLTIDSQTARDPAQYEADLMQDIADIMQTDAGRRLIRELRNPASEAPTKLVPSPSGEPMTRGVIEPGTGTPFPDGSPGRGSESEIQFNGQKDAVVGDRRYRSDVALYHEMVHALHDVQGTTDWSWVEREDGVPSDVERPTRRAEHQATGLGRYEVTPHNENLYRAERRALAFSGEGRPGDLMMRDRESYRGGSTYASFFGL